MKNSGEATIVRYIANKENVMDMFDRLLVGVIASDYNEECFDLMQVQRHSAMCYVLEDFIDKFIKAGYCARTLLNPLMLKRGFNEIKKENAANLSEILDDKFLLDMSEFQQAMGYAYGMYDQYKDRC